MLNKTRLHFSILFHIQISININQFCVCSLKVSLASEYFQRVFHIITQGQYHFSIQHEEHTGRDWKICKNYSCTSISNSTHRYNSAAALSRTHISSAKVILAQELFPCQHVLIGYQQNQMLFIQAVVNKQGFNYPRACRLFPTKCNLTLGLNYFLKNKKILTRR